MGRKPTQLKIVKGTFQPERANEDEPAFVFAIPTPPAYLSPEEREAWDMFAKTLAGMRITTDDDRVALEMLSCTYAQYQRFQAVLRKKGDTYETTTAAGSKMFRPRPEQVLLGDCERKLLNLLGRFGLTPADRQRVSDLAKGSGGGRGVGEDKDKEFT